MTRPVLAIHGGCGVMAQADLSEAEWQEAREALAQSLRAGWVILSAGGAALDAVQAAVVVLEDSPHFNAGHGSALNAAGYHELDAAIMDGAGLAAGAICAAQAVRNPVLAARAVLEARGALLIAGPSADRFAESAGLPLALQSYFTTPRRLAALQAMKAQTAPAEKHGTVGAVALDASGHLAAATSTGGYTMKPEGRVGDSPIIGAGTYARDGICAVSGTGKGEEFIRHAVGHDLAARMSYLGEPIDIAADNIIHDKLGAQGIGAGLVAVSADGRITAPYNTGGMFRAWVNADGSLSVASHARVHCLPG